MYAIIGGSGFEKFDGFQVIKNLDRNTPFGLASSGLKLVKVGANECIFLSKAESNNYRQMGAIRKVIDPNHTPSVT
ncbi:MAG: hypothetical protein A2Z20_09420 [Bdellovibrionales bacterium RBG_16_40_8]|nr:MAG: hypothetical protein A2Z20_09420 [Bdellovibrionales bacterium RBG_16_40_8]